MDDIIVVTSSSMDRSGGVKRERETSLFSCQKVVWPDRMGSEGAEWSSVDGNNNEIASAGRRKGGVGNKRGK